MRKFEFCRSPQLPRFYARPEEVSTLLFACGKMLISFSFQISMLESLRFDYTESCRVIWSLSQLTVINESLFKVSQWAAKRTVSLPDLVLWRESRAHYVVFDRDSIPREIDQVRRHLENLRGTW